MHLFYELKTFDFTLSDYFWSHLPDSNRGPSLYKSVALPTELRWQIKFHTTGISNL